MLLGERIRNLREQKGLTQTELGKEINASKATISHYENNTRTPSMDIIRRIAEYFGVDTNDLLGLNNIAYSDNKIISMSDEEIELMIEIRKLTNYSKIMSDPQRYAKLLDINIPRD